MSRNPPLEGKEVPVTVSSDGKAGWYFDVVTPEIPHHLAKGGILTAHGGHVVGADVFEPANVASGHPSSVATYQDPPTSALRIDPTSSSPKASCERTAGPYMRMRSRDRPGFVFMACSSKALELALPPRVPYFERPVSEPFICKPQVRE